MNRAQAQRAHASTTGQDSYDFHLISSNRNVIVIFVRFAVEGMSFHVMSRYDISKPHTDTHTHTHSRVHIIYFMYKYCLKLNENKYRVYFMNCFIYIKCKCNRATYI